jgi:hypothetical protein
VEAGPADVCGDVGDVHARRVPQGLAGPPGRGERVGGVGDVGEAAAVGEPAGGAVRGEEGACGDPPRHLRR